MMRIIYLMFLVLNFVSCDLSGMLGLRPKPVDPDARIESFSVLPFHNQDVRKEYHGIIVDDTIRIPLPNTLISQDVPVMATIRATRGEIWPKDPQPITSGTTYTLKTDAGESVYKVLPMLDTEGSTQLAVSKPFYLEGTRKIPLLRDWAIDHIDDHIVLELSPALMQTVGDKPIGFLIVDSAPGATMDSAYLTEGFTLPYHVSLTSGDGLYETTYLISKEIFKDESTRIQSLQGLAHDEVTITSDVSGLTPPLAYFNTWRNGSSLELNPQIDMGKYHLYNSDLFASALRNKFLTKLYWGELRYPRYGVYRKWMFPLQQWPGSNLNGDTNGLNTLWVLTANNIEIPDHEVKPDPLDDPNVPLVDPNPSGYNFEQYKKLRLIYGEGSFRTTGKTLVALPPQALIDNHDIYIPAYDKDETIDDEALFIVNYKPFIFWKSGIVAGQVHYHENDFTFHDPYAVKGIRTDTFTPTHNYHTFSSLTVGINEGVSVQNIILGDDVLKPHITRDAILFSFKKNKTSGFIASFDLVDARGHRQNHKLALQGPAS